MKVPDGGLIAKHIEIYLDPQPRQSETQKLKLYNMATFLQNIQLWLIVFHSLASLISNLSSIASSLGIFPHNNNKSQCVPKL